MDWVIHVRELIDQFAGFIVCAPGISSLARFRLKTIHASAREDKLIVDGADFTSIIAIANALSCKNNPAFSRENNVVVGKEYDNGCSALYLLTIQLLLSRS